MYSPDKITTSSPTESRWVTPGILASTATDRTKALESSMSTVSSSTPGDPFLGVWKWASNRQQRRFPKNVDGRPELRPAQRLELLRPAEEEREAAGECHGDAKGRRLYLGNLAYAAKPEEIEAFVRGRLAGEDGALGGAGGYVGMHISVDEFTGRNPSYCFLEFEDPASASRAMELLGGEMLRGRRTKCSPCQPRGGTLAGRRRDESSGAAFRRWGDYISGGHGSDANMSSAEGGQDGPQGPNQALAYYQGRGEGVKRRLYVGGLPRMHDQAMAYHEMVKFFEGFKVVTVSKRFSPPPSRRANGRCSWQLVDFASPEEAAAALKAKKHGRWRGAALKLEWARSNMRRTGKGGVGSLVLPESYRVTR